MRDKGTGKSKGFAFIAYEDQRSTNLAVGGVFTVPFNFCDEERMAFKVSDEDTLVDLQTI